MLKLDWLEMAGFKSFAHKTRIQFSPGINCIIGPNGCGKSNLSESIGWVLGAGNPQSLRVESMDDVIFSGTSKRRKSGFVHTTLAFSNGDQTPVLLKESGIEAEALEIGRKLYRSGESAYSLNQNRCRLLDIRSAMEESGLGFASYALIAQGKINWFLRAKPVDRRSIIEEAAQISGYKSRRRSAELKLELAQQNLVRVNDIVAEIERQLRSLKRQAAKARRYKRLKEEFREVQQQKLAWEASQLDERLAEMERELKEYQQIDAELSAELADQEEAHRKDLEAREAMESQLATLRRDLAENQRILDRTEGSLENHRQQVEAIRKALEVNASEQESLASSLERVKQELLHFQSETQSLRREEERIRGAIGAQTEQVENYQKELVDSEARIKELQSELSQVSEEQTSLNNQKTELEHGLKLAQAARERLQKEHALHRVEMETSLTGSRASQVSLESKRTETEQLAEQLAVQATQQQKAKKILEEVRAELDGTQKKLIGHQERLQSLQEIELTHAQYSEGVQSFLSHLKSNQNVQTGGTLADCIETHHQYERLVEEFLDEELEYILVDSLDEAVQGISELRNLDSGRCTFLTLTSTNGFDKIPAMVAAPESSSSAGVHGVLTNILEMKPEVRTAFHRTLPQRAGAVVVSNLDTAFDLAHQYPDCTFVTLEGESLTPRGLLSASGGHARKLGLLSLKRQKKDLEGRVIELQKGQVALEEQERKADEGFLLATQLVDASQEQLRELEKEIIALTHEERHWQVEESRQKKALQVIEEEVEQLNPQQASYETGLQLLEEKFREGKALLSEKEGMLLQGRESCEQLREESARSREQLHLLSSDKKVMKERLSALERTLERIEEQRTGLVSNRESAQAAQKEDEKRLSSTGEMIQALINETAAGQNEIDTLSSHLEQREAEYLKWKELYPKREKQLTDLRARKADLQEKRSGIEVARARIETQLQNIDQQCQEQLQQSMEEVVKGLDISQIPAEEISSRYDRLREQLDSFGPINLAALEEYQEAEERHTFLTAQRQDIESSIADTSRAIQEINRRSREQFRTTFEAVNHNFNGVFQRLFGGGEAGMRLLDEDDILESGIDIYAQPPGKRLQNVRLLSGGEEALTVFALLMGIFTHRRSRFCVLDEVDAPLDESNVTRFANLLQEMSAETQFIVITHNKLTMQKADALYGVTMEEPGLSKLVSVKLDGLD